VRAGSDDIYVRGGLRGWDRTEEGGGTREGMSRIRGPSLPVAAGRLVVAVVEIAVRLAGSGTGAVGSHEERPTRTGSAASH
jgi:hypothetical protein